ncbi:MAG: hypothetical protein AAF500_07615 [Myxococcota bacterium]
MRQYTLWLAIVGLLAFAGCTPNPEATARMEDAEDLEESMGDEAALIGDNPDDMDGWDTPGGEVEAEMEAEPYPE